MAEEDSAIASALTRTLEADDDAGEAVNVVDVLMGLSGATRRIADAITPNLVGSKDAYGGHVESLTEAMMGVTGGLVQIAESIADLAQAVREREHGYVTKSKKGD